MNTKPPSRIKEEASGTKPSGSRRGRGEATELACSRLMRIIDGMDVHTRLPGLRTLQAQIGVSQGTLNAALDKLEQKRVLLRRERSGVYVAPHIRRRTICLICSLDFFLRSNGSPFWQLLVEAFDNLGVVPGRDIAVACYANAGSPVLLGWHNRVYRLEYDVAALVERLFKTLESLMDNGADALSGAFVPPFEYDDSEYSPTIAGERFQLILSRLVPPESKL